MNQLVTCCENFVLCALKDTAFILCDQSKGICELKSKATDATNQPAPSETEKENTQDQTPSNHDEKRQITDEELRAIHAVGLAKDDRFLYCALARGDKSLSIYKTKFQNGLPSDILPSLVHNTAKRLSCIHMTEWPFKGIESPLLLLAGDMAGDAYAFDLQSQKQRLLLGHTASMLTGLKVLNNMLLTADRDEKIRISSFPQTVAIEGFLLGHEAYVTAVDGTSNGMLVTSGGDSTVRLWDLKNRSQICSLPFTKDTEQHRIPTDLALTADGKVLVVIFDQCNEMNLYQLKGSGADSKLEIIAKTQCASQPLGICCQGNSFFVVQREPTFLAKYTITGESVEEDSLGSIKDLKKVATERGITMPSALLERDQYGQIKLSKRHETRGPAAGDKPWNRAERVDIAKAATKRHKRRRRGSKSETE